MQYSYSSNLHKQNGGQIINIIIGHFKAVFSYECFTNREKLTTEISLLVK